MNGTETEEENKTKQKHIHENIKRERIGWNKEGGHYFKIMLGKEWKIMFRARWDSETELNVRKDREQGPRGRPVPIISYRVPAGQSLLYGLHRGTNTFQGVDRSAV